MMAAKQLLQGLCIDAVRILNATPVSSNGKHTVYRNEVSYGYHLYEWTLTYSVKHMEYILSNEMRYHFPPNRKLQPVTNSPPIAVTTHIREIYLFSAQHGVYTDLFQVCSKVANVLCIDAANLIIGGGRRACATTSACCRCPSTGSTDSSRLCSSSPRAATSSAWT